MQNEWSEDEKCRLKEDFIIFYIKKLTKFLIIFS